MPPSRPNILCFVTDQQRADHLACMGNPDVQTPNIDRLAREGVVFTESFVANVVCMPNRACMFTGRYPKANGVRENGIPLQPNDRVLPEVLRRAGYQTASFGKIHLSPFGGKKEQGLRPHELVESHEFWAEGGELPLPYHGLEHVYFVGGHVYYTFGHYKRDLDRIDPALHVKYSEAEALVPPSGAPESWKLAIPAELHYNTAIADRTIDYIKARDAGRPFFIWCSFPDPHHPFAAPRPWCDMYDPRAITFAPARREGELDELPPYFRRCYEGRQPTSGLEWDMRTVTDDHLREMKAHTYGMISMVDANVGRIVAALDEQGLLDNTIIVFLSDHADMMGDHWLGKKGPFLFRCLTRVPTVWRLPKGLAKQGATDAPISTVDLMPTLLELCGVECPAGVQGVSYADVLGGKRSAARDAVYIEFDEAYIGDRLRQLRTKEWAITFLANSNSGMLFDLRNDPDELHNLWDDPKHPDIKRELLAELLRQTIRADDLYPAKTAHA
ncbi:MAG: sulfatase-like hydrolase/transferase [Verrucomicrobia bacterium]|nr:sulfatase-like hydrolase/transferase [Verrucomicrobiota bacterium]